MIQSNVLENFAIEVNCVNAEKPLLNYLPNPHIKIILKRRTNDSNGLFSVKKIFKKVNYQYISSWVQMIYNVSNLQNQQCRVTTLTVIQLQKSPHWDG